MGQEVKNFADGDHQTAGAGKVAKRAVTDLEKALLTREEWLRLAAQGSDLGLWYWNERTNSLFWDQKTRGFFGVPLEGEVTLDMFYGAVHPDDRMRVEQVWRSQLEGGIPYALEYRALRPDGCVRWINARGNGYYGTDGEPLYMIGVVFDVTDRKEAEQERLELSGRLIVAQEQERKRLAQEIHDDFCQRFAVLSVRLRTLARDELPRNPLVDELIGEMATLETDLQAFAHRLYSPKLKLLGLVPSIESLCKDFSRDYGVQVRCEHADVPGDIASDRGLSLFRITQEALHNVAKHSGATCVAIDLKRQSDNIALSVFDNGTGFTPSENGAPQGIGLQSIRERVRMMGGTVLFQSRPAVEGTRIAVMIPLEDRPAH
jgi:PAS domain S-box-containing protein